MSTNFFMLSNGGHSDGSTVDEVEIGAGSTSPLQNYVDLEARSLGSEYRLEVYPPSAGAVVDNGEGMFTFTPIPNATNATLTSTASIRTGITSPSVRSPLSNIDWGTSTSTGNRWDYDPPTMYQDEMTRRFINDRVIQETMEHHFREINSSMTVPPLTQVSSRTEPTRGPKAPVPKYSPTEQTLIKFLKEKVELKLNGIKTDTTIELTLSLNLLDTGESLISTQDVIEVD